MSTQFIGKLTAEDLNDVQKNTHSKTYWYALRSADIAKLLFRTLAVLVALASTAGYAFLRMLWCGHDSREDSSLTRRVSISLPGLRLLQ
jgi:hypothetical protein